MVTTCSFRAFAVSKLTTRSNRGRGDNPKIVEKRRIVGWKPPVAAPSSASSESTLVSAYSEIGWTWEFSFMTCSDAPYTLQLEAKMKRWTCSPLAISIIMRVAA